MSLVSDTDNDSLEAIAIEHINEAQQVNVVEPINESIREHTYGVVPSVVKVVHEAVDAGHIDQVTEIAKKFRCSSG